MSAYFLKPRVDFSKLVWSEESKCWTCSLCKKTFSTQIAYNRHAKRNCENAQPQYPCWKLGWDRRTMSCCYCKQTFTRRRGIRRHLQLKRCPSLPDWGRLFGYRTEESQSARQNQGQGRRRGQGVRSSKGRAKGIGQQRPTPGAVPGTGYKEEDCDDWDEDEEEESSRLFPGEDRDLADGDPQEERPWGGLQHGLSGGWPSDLRRQSQASGDRPHLYSPRQSDHMQARRPDRHSEDEEYLGPSFQGQSHPSSRDLPGKCSKGSLDTPPKNWPSDRSCHSSTHTKAARTWTGNQRARTSQTWPEQEFQHGPEDCPEKQYDQNSSFAQLDERYISTGHESLSRHEQNREPIHRNSQERQGRSTHAKHFGERLSSRDRYNALKIKFPSDRYPDKERRKNSDMDGSLEGRFISDRHGNQRVSRHSRDMSPQRTESRGSYHKSPERMERQDYIFNRKSPPESRHDSYKSTERMERFGSYCKSPERMERLSSHHKSRDREEGHGSYHGTPERIKRRGSHHSKYCQRSHSPIRRREIESELDRGSQYSGRRNQDLYRNGNHSPTSYRHQENSRLLDPDSHQERMLRCDSAERYEERLFPDVCDSVDRIASPVRDDPFWMSNLESRNSPGGRLSPEGHFRSRLSITRHSPCQEDRGLRDYPRRRSHSPRHRETEHRRNSQSRYSEAEIHDSTLREKEQEHHHQRDYSLRRRSRSPIRRETESRRHSRSRHSETGMLESSRRLGSLLQDSRPQRHSPRRFSRSPHRHGETESRQHSQSRHTETGVLESSRRLGSLSRDSLSRGWHHSPRRFSRSPHRRRETESRRHSQSRHSETGVLESSRRLGSLPQDGRPQHLSSRRFSHSPHRRGETESRRHSQSRHSETGMLESRRRLETLSQDSRAWHLSPRTSRRLSRSPVRRETEDRQHSRSRHSETGMLESHRRLGSLLQDEEARHHSPRRLSRRSPVNLRDSRSGYLETGCGDTSRRRHDSRQEKDQRGHSPRRRSRSPVRRRETGGHRDSGSRHAERGIQDSYRTSQGRERRPVPEEPSRHRTHHEDRRQEPREHGRSRDAGYRGHQRDRGRGRHRR